MPASEILRDLQARIRRMETAGRNPRGLDGVSSGFAELDRLLGGGLSGGTLIEWLGTGRLTLALAVSGHIARAGRAVVIISERTPPFPPALAGLGVPLERTIVVRPTDTATLLWAWEQSLRCEGIAVTLGRLDDDRDVAMRRLQLAAEAGGGLGFLIRPSEGDSGRRKRRVETVWAEARLAVRGLPNRDDSGAWRLRVELLRSRSGPGGASVELEVGCENLEANDVPVALELGGAEGEVFTPPLPSGERGRG